MGEETLISEMNFKDYFSKQSKEYSQYRPTYPEELFEFLNTIVSNRDLALDCATGNGQAVQSYIETHNSNPLHSLENDLKKVWGENIKREVKWKIKMKAGRNDFEFGN